MPRFALPFAAALLLVAAPADASSIDREGMLRVLRRASPAIADCAAAHALPPGRYAVRIAILQGRAREVRLVDSRTPLAIEGRGCLENAFLALAYPALASVEDGRPVTYRVTYPFVLREPYALEVARVRPAPARWRPPR